ncbi:MAG: PD-(D/E)XK nuclease family transposase [Bacteroidales bacterium]|nr:PD-(D/E)XK nuclease family transposase [Bacteroidales bacterium]MCF8456390.1 PD-(D/E)XK nuclease family transposase [Bacteroidales bacterium]
MGAKKLIRFDWAMKTLLRDKANFDVLEGFLSALLEDDNLKILTILESETNQEGEEDKFNRVDLLVQDSQKRKIYIEIQNTRESDYLESLLFATSKIIVENQKLGKDFSDVNKIISISILYFNLGLGDDYIYFGTTKFMGVNTGNPLIVKRRVNISKTFEPKYKFVEKRIFPEYYLITVERYKNVIKKRIDEWIYMIKNNEVADGSTSRNIDKARQKLDEINMGEAEKKRYERYLINLARDRDVINTAKAEGHDEGEKIGMKKGMAKERENTAKEKAIMAKKMKIKGIPIEEITEYTGLTKDQIQKL